MAKPDPYDRQYSFSGYQALNPSQPLPADQVDNEFSAVKVAMDATQANLALIQRDDGKLANNSVGKDQLAADLSIGFTFRGQWAAGVNYSSNDGVFLDNIFYRATEAHLSAVETSPDVAPDTWEVLAQIAASTTVSDGAVITSKIADGAVTNTKIATGAVSTTKLADASVTAAKLAAGAAEPPLGFTPVQQGGGAGQGSNKLYLGWSGSKLKLQVDAADYGALASESWVSGSFATTASLASYATQSWSYVNFYTKSQVDTSLAAKLPLAGGTMTGTLTMGSGAEITITNGRIVQERGGAGIAYVGYYNRASDSGTMFRFARIGTTVGSIDVSPGTTAYNTSSDKRIKTNVVPAPDYGAIIDAAEVVQFTMIADPDATVRTGFLAQDLKPLFPTAVTEGSGAPGDAEFVPWSVDLSKLVPVLWREVQSLRARVAALESA